MCPKWLADRLTNMIIQRIMYTLTSVVYIEPSFLRTKRKL